MDLVNELSNAGSLDHILLLLKQIATIQELYGQEYGIENVTFADIINNKSNKQPETKKRPREQTPEKSEDDDDQEMEDVESEEEPPVKRRRLQKYELIEIEDDDEEIESQKDTPLFSSASAVLHRCIKRRARPTGRAFEEECLSSEDKHSTMLNYKKIDKRVERVQYIHELGMIQRLIMELDLCLRITPYNIPKTQPFSIPKKVASNSGAIGERRPFLSIRGLNKLNRLNIVPHLLKGDLIHVPFTPEEQVFLLKNLSENLVQFIKRNTKIQTIEQVVSLAKTHISKIYQYLPGRSIDDCLRWLQSFINRKVYEKIKLPEEKKLLYDQQDKLQIYSPKEPSPLLSINPIIVKNAPIKDLLLLRDINALKPLAHVSLIISRYFSKM